MKYTIKTILIIIASLIVVFLIPYGYHIDLGPGPDAIQAIIWEIYGLGDDVIFRLTIPSRIYIEYNFFRYAVLIGIIIYYFLNCRRMYILIVAIIGELIPLIISIPGFFILNETGDNLIPIIIPIPSLLAFILMLIFLFPYNKLKKID